MMMMMMKKINLSSSFCVNVCCFVVVQKKEKKIWEFFWERKFSLLLLSYWIAFVCRCRLIQMCVCVCVCVVMILYVDPISKHFFFWFHFFFLFQIIMMMMIRCFSIFWTTRLNIFSFLFFFFCLGALYTFIFFLNFFVCFIHSFIVYCSVFSAPLNTNIYFVGWSLVVVVGGKKTVTKRESENICWDSFQEDFSCEYLTKQRDCLKSNKWERERAREKKKELKILLFIFARVWIFCWKFFKKFKIFKKLSKNSLLS